MSIGTNVVIALLVFWSISQIISAIPFFPSDIREVLVRTKVFIGPAVLLVVALSSRRWLRVSTTYVPMVAFSLYSALNLIFRLEPNWPRAFLSIAWAGCFVLIPSLLFTRQRVELFMKGVLPAISVSLALAIVLSILNDDYLSVGGSRRRYYFGMNPNYFASSAFSLAYAGFASLVLMPRHRSGFAWLCLIGGCVLTYLTDGRTFILGLVTSVIVYSAYATGLIGQLARAALGLSAVSLIGLTLFFTMSPLSSVQRFNEVSSGRILVWYSALKTNLGSGELLPLLWGQTDVSFDLSDAEWKIAGRTRHDAFDTATQIKADMGRFSLDNAYLDILLMTGLIGLILVLWAWIRWWRALRPERGESLMTRRTKALTRSLLAGFLITALFSSSWPAMGNVLISFGLTLSIALTAVLATEQKEGYIVATPSERPAWNPPGKIR